MTNFQDRLRTLLAEMVQADQADLDFGIYRIMNLKRDEFLRFLDADLFPQVGAILSGQASGAQAALADDIQKMEANLSAAGLTVTQIAEASKVQELRRQYEALAGGSRAEDDLFSDLFDFFRRYYDKGDFLALPRYQKNVYALPYQGEEVKLHWANADQYYVKSSESFRDYEFRLPDNRRVHFRLAAAKTETDNNKAGEGKKRVFVLAEGVAAVSEQDDALVIRFRYQAAPDKRSQDALNADAARAILDALEKRPPRPNSGEPEGVWPGRSGEPEEKEDLAFFRVPQNWGGGASSWADALAAPAPTEKNKGRTLLDRKLADYTARNSFDYFIHKDLGRFLRRELDFYLKNEILLLDDLDGMTPEQAAAPLRRVQALRKIAHKIIDFLAQLEDFQRSLWLKKKFVVQSGWCVTLDRVPPALYAEVAANERQRAEWVSLLKIDAIGPDTTQPGYSVPLSVPFLQAHPFLVLDTQFFGADFVDALLASADVLGGAADLDAATDGVIVNGDNFQALSLLGERYREQVKCIYIDPPYNTGGDGFAYKDNYQHSSWLSMMSDRLTQAHRLLPDDGALFVSIDDDEQANLKRLLDETFGPENFVASIIWQKKYAPQNDAKWFSDDHDFIVNYAKDRNVWRPTKLARTEEQDKLYKNPDSDPRGVWASDNYLSNKSADQRPNLYYAILHPATGKEIWPPQNAVWRYTRQQHEQNVKDNRVWWGKDGTNSVPRFKRFLTEVGNIVPRTIWPYTDVGHNQDAVRELRDMLPQSAFASPKPTRLIRRILEINPADVTLDYFAGSGTTGHAVINLNREDNGHRKYILVEMGQYFNTVLKPRLQKVIHSKDWKDGHPVSRQGSSHLFQYLALESYEDTLNNLTLTQTPAQAQALAQATPNVREEYQLRYNLHFESRDSLLSARDFDAPFGYTLRIAQDTAGDTQPQAVDLVETFHWLLGLRVERRETREGIKLIWGRMPEPGRKRVLILWRTVADWPHDELNDFFARHGLGAGSGDDAPPDVVYVNGDNALLHRRPDGQNWDVRMIEPEFLRRMFGDSGRGRA